MSRLVFTLTCNLKWSSPVCTLLETKRDSTANSAQHTLLGRRSQHEGTSGGSEALALFNRYGFFFFVNQVIYYESYQLGETDFSSSLSTWPAENKALKGSLQF